MTGALPGPAGTLWQRALCSVSAAPAQSLNARGLEAFAKVHAIGEDPRFLGVELVGEQIPHVVRTSHHGRGHAEFGQHTDPGAGVDAVAEIGLIGGVGDRHRLRIGVLERAQVEEPHRHRVAVGQGRGTSPYGRFPPLRPDRCFVLGPRQRCEVVEELSPDRPHFRIDVQDLGGSDDDGQDPVHGRQFFIGVLPAP